MDKRKPLNKNLTIEELSGWVEFACWTALLITPFVNWLNGPPVTTDQLIVRAAVIVLALTGGIVLRTIKLVNRKRLK